MSENIFSKSSILIVDDEQEHAQVMCEALQRIGHKCDVTFNLAEAQSRLNRKNYDVIVTDLMMDNRRDGLEVLRRAKTQTPPPPVLLVTAINDVPTSKQAMQEGAYDYIVKPLDMDDFRTQVNRAAERASLTRQNMALQEQLLDTAGFEGIIGSNQAMQNVLQTAR